MVNDKYLVTLEFRYSDVPVGEWDGECKIKKITIGIFDDFDRACIAGNKVLEMFEARFPLNPNYNVKERFSKNGGCFGFRKTLITNLGYLTTPFAFFAKITDLKIRDVDESIDEVLDAGIRCKKYRAEKDD